MIIDGLSFVNFTVMWLLVGIVLVLIELAMPGLFFFLSFAFGSLFGAIASFIGYSLLVQCFVVLLVSLIQFNSMRRVLRRFNEVKAEQGETNMQGLIGRVAHVVRAIIPPNHGYVKIGGEEWAAEHVNQELIEKDTQVRVVRVVGNRVIVKKYDKKVAHLRY